ncbi:MAG: ribose 5-phosphate isomerase B [Oligoflexia bacterium]|nr:ribose 5-phosphate isomerase B [Oligoflexia bacterium]
MARSPSKRAPRTRKVLIASDHAGIELKAAIQKSLPEWDWEDLGPINGNRVDYPDFAEKLARRVSDGDVPRGILICGSGIGMSIAANKIRGIRAAAVENPVAARLAREHNDTNVLCLGSRFVAPEYGAEIAKVWLETPFSGDDRHRTRVEKIERLETKSK